MQRIVLENNIIIKSLIDDSAANNDRNTSMESSKYSEASELERSVLSENLQNKRTSDVETEVPLEIKDQLIEVRERMKSEFYNHKDENFAAWEQHSSGFGSKMLHKMGYSEGGLGKDQNGIINPIKITHKNGHGGIGSYGSKKPINDYGPINRDLGRLVADVLPAGEKFVTNRVENIVKPWPVNTTLITGDSILFGVEESRLQKYKAKVRVFPGAFVDDMYDYLMPLLRQKPSNIILHIGSKKKSDFILSEMTI